MGAPEVRAYVVARPAIGERGYRDLARRLVAVGRRAVLMVPEGERPHPRRSLRRRVHLEDATDRNPIGEHVEVVLVLLAGWAGSRCALKDQHRTSAGSVLLLQEFTSGFPRFLLISVCIHQWIPSAHIFRHRQE